MKRLSYLLGVAYCLFFVASLANGQEFSAADIEFFENKIRPILVENCNECHSPDADFLEAGLDVTSRVSLLAGGDSGPAIVPGNIENSLLVQVVTYEGPYEMPPSSKLPDEKIDLLKEWVKRGSPWPAHDDHQKTIAKEFDLQKRKNEHWCWQPIKSQSVPATNDQHWGRDPLDSFVLQKLTDNNLKPAEECDKATWIRRVSFDLTGMPPSPEEVDEFINDPSQDAYQKVVERLLSSPQFGERWTRHWMDLVRYAETYGHEFDYPIAHAYQYRDYLIRAFNNDVPFNEFIIEHVAGDLIEHPRRHADKGYNESILATGFWHLGEATHAPVDVKADEAGRIDNQIDVLCRTFLGLTVACARCHDHKFDAISAADYYALSGFLQSSRRQIALLDPEQKIERNRIEAKQIAAAADQEIDDFVTELRTVSKEQWLEAINNFKQQKSDKVENESLAVDAIALNKIANFELVKNQEMHPLHLFSWLNQDLSLLKIQVEQYKKKWKQREKQYHKFTDSSVLYEDFENGIPDGWFLTGASYHPNLRELEFSPVGSLIYPGGVYSSGRFGGRFQSVLRSPTFELTHDKLAIRLKGRSARIRLIIDGYEMDIHNPLLFNGCKVDVVQDKRFEWVLMQADVKNYRGHKAYLEFIDHGDGFLQVDEIRFLNNGSPGPVDPPSVFSKTIVDKGPKTELELRDAIAEGLVEFFNRGAVGREICELMSAIADHSEFGQALKAKRDELVKLSEATPDPIKAIAMADGSPEDEHLFIRGSSSNLGEIIPRQFLTALRPDNIENVEYLHGSGRLDLANKIANADNPLTSRVIVNRIWRHMFGAGIVKSVDNFGVLGEEPSHPELLDYLAREFTSNGWSIKSLIRRIALSQTYRMSSKVNKLGNQVDPENRLLHRANVNRLEGEAIRDSMLKIAGSLDTKMFGPSVEVHLTEFMQGRGRPRKGGPIDGAGRRSLYIKIRRNFLAPMMLAFDTPIPFNAIGNRHRSNVPAQALILMNDPFVVGQAEKWADKLMATTDSLENRIGTAFRQAFGRSPSQSELDGSIEFVNQQADELAISAEQALNDKRIWKDFCHVVFNMKEMIYIK